MIKYIKLIIIIIICSQLIAINVNTAENKILLKINNQIITSLDILTELDYLTTINKELKKIEKEKAFEISKNSIIREKIIEDFLDTCSKNRGEIKADLSSSKELNDTDISKIKEELASNFGANINLNYKYDPSLIGGLIIKVESTMIDTSIKSKLKQLEKKMVEV